MKTPQRFLGSRTASAVLAGALAWFITIPATSIAQPYPSKTVRLIVGFTPGGNADVIARIVATRLSAHLDQQVVVDNRPGADAGIAMNIVAKSPADGYTLYLVQSGIAINPFLYKNVQFDPIRDFTPITLVGEIPSLIAVHPSLPTKNLKEFIALAKRRPGELSYAATSSPTMLATELFKRTAGIAIERINFRGSAPAMTALLTGDVQLILSGIGSLLPLTKAGKVRSLALSSEKRSPLAPEIPTAIESGLPGFTASVWYGIAAPGNTPRAVVDRVNAEIRKLLAESDVKSRLLVQGVEPAPNSPEQFSEMIKSEISKWERVVKESGIRID